MRRITRPGDYGYFRPNRRGDEVVIRGTREHKLTFIPGHNETFIVRCRREGCGFRVAGVTSLAEAERIATAHLADQ